MKIFETASEMREFVANGAVWINSEVDGGIIYRDFASMVEHGQMETAGDSARPEGFITEFQLVGQAKVDLSGLLESMQDDSDTADWDEDFKE